MERKLSRKNELTKRRYKEKASKTKFESAKWMMSKHKIEDGVMRIKLPTSQNCVISDLI